MVRLYVVSKKVYFGEDCEQKPTSNKKKEKKAAVKRVTSEKDPKNCLKKQKTKTSVQLSHCSEVKISTSIPFVKKKKKTN